MLSVLRIILAILLMALLWKLKLFMDSRDAELEKEVQAEKEALIDGPIRDMVISIGKESLAAVRKAQADNAGSTWEERYDLYHHWDILFEMLKAAQLDEGHLEARGTSRAELASLIGWLKETLETKGNMEDAGEKRSASLPEQGT